MKLISREKFKAIGKFGAKIFLIVYFYFYFAKIGHFAPEALTDPLVQAPVEIYGGVILISAVSAVYRPWTALLGLIGGEFLVQVVEYGTVNPLLVLPLMPFAIIPGIPKYEKHKYLRGSNLVNLCTYNLVASLASIGTTGALIILIHQTLTEANLFTLLFSWLGSFIAGFFLSVALVYGFEKLTEREELYNEILTHHPPYQADHAFAIEINGTRIYFCTRCSGMIVGVLLLVFIGEFVDYTLSQDFIFWACLIIPIIALLDWGTQKLGFRQSNTVTRLITGFCVGMAMYLLSFTRDENRVRVLILVMVYFVIFFLLYFLGSKFAQKRTRRIMDQLESREYSEKDPEEEADGEDSLLTRNGNGE